MTTIITRYKGQKITAENFTMLAHRLTRVDAAPYIDWDADPYTADELDDASYSGMVNALGVRLSAAETDAGTYSEGDWDSLAGGEW